MCGALALAWRRGHCAGLALLVFLSVAARACHPWLTPLFSGLCLVGFFWCRGTVQIGFFLLRFADRLQEKLPPPLLRDAGSAYRALLLDVLRSALRILVVSRGADHAVCRAIERRVAQHVAPPTS